MARRTDRRGRSGPPVLSPSGTVVVAVAAATIAVLPVFLTGALTVQIRPGLQVTTGDIGIAIASFFGASAICSATFGALAERAGSTVLMRIAAGVSLVALCGVALFAHHLWSLAAFLAVGGVGNGAMQPAVNQLLTRAVRRERQGLAFGVKQAAIPASTLLSGLAVPVLALTFGWRAAFLVAGALALAVLVGISVLGSRLGGTTPAPIHRQGPRGATDGSSLSGLFARPLLVLAAAMAMAVAASNAMGAFVVPSAVAHGVAPGLAGLLAALGSITGLTARVTLGWRADTSPNHGLVAAHRHLRTVSVLLALGVLGYLALASGSLALLVPGTLLAFGAGWGYNGLFNLAVVRAYPSSPARATGITQVGTYIGGMVGPLGFGLLVDHQGYDLAWVLCGAVAAAGAGVFVIGRRYLARSTVAAPASSI
ncbi:MAG: MFS transporter [Actinomycetota bacterium]|nr:MFS transporter [Actinomycetota bacterium]